MFIESLAICWPKDIDHHGVTYLSKDSISVKFKFSSVFSANRCHVTRSNSSSRWITQVDAQTSFQRADCRPILQDSPTCACVARKRVSGIQQDQTVHVMWKWLSDKGTYRAVRWQLKTEIHKRPKLKNDPNSRAVTITIDATQHNSHDKKHATRTTDRAGLTLTKSATLTDRV